MEKAWFGEVKSAWVIRFVYIFMYIYDYLCIGYMYRLYYIISVYICTYYIAINITHMYTLHIYIYIYIYIGNNNPNWLSYFSEGWVNHQPVQFFRYKSMESPRSSRPLGRQLPVAAAAERLQLCGCGNGTRWTLGWGVEELMGWL